MIHHRLSVIACACACIGAADVPPPGRNMAAELQAEYEREKAAPAAARRVRTYTAAELRERIARKDYPAQWPPESTTVAMGFGECLLAVQATADAARQAGNPAETPVINDLMRMTKIWALDAAITLSCSRLDRVQIRTVAQYR